MKNALLILLLLTPALFADKKPKRNVTVKDSSPTGIKTDVGGHLLVESSGIKTDVDGHLIVEHTRAMTNSKRRSRATDDLDRMLEAMLREAQWEMELEQMYHEFFGGRGDFPIYEKYEYEWSSGDTEDVEPSDNDDYTITITDGD